MIPDRVKQRLRKDKAMTAVTLRMPEDVLASLKELAPLLGFSGYQALMKAYVSEGMRRDEARLFFGPAQQLAERLKQRGVDPQLVDEALHDIKAA